MSDQIYVNPVLLADQKKYETIKNPNPNAQKTDLPQNKLNKPKGDDQPLSPRCNKEKLKRLERRQEQKNKSVRIFTEEVDKYIVNNSKPGELPKQVCDDIKNIKNNMEEEQENLASEIKTLTLDCKSPGNTLETSSGPANPTYEPNTNINESEQPIYVAPPQSGNPVNVKLRRGLQGTVRTNPNPIEQTGNVFEMIQRFEKKPTTSVVGKKRRTMKKNKNKKSVKKNTNKKKATMKKRIRQERKSNKKKTKQ